MGEWWDPIIFICSMLPNPWGLNKRGPLWHFAYRVSKKSSVSMHFGDFHCQSLGSSKKAQAPFDFSGIFKCNLINVSPFSRGPKLYLLRSRFYPKVVPLCFFFRPKRKQERNRDKISCCANLVIRSVDAALHWPHWSWWLAPYYFSLCLMLFPRTQRWKWWKRNMSLAMATWRWGKGWEVENWEADVFWSWKSTFLIFSRVEIGSNHPGCWVRVFFTSCKKNV